MTTRRAFLAGTTLAAAGLASTPRAFAESRTVPLAAPATDLTRSTRELLNPDYHDFVDTFGTFEINDRTLADFRSKLDGFGAAGRMPEVARVFDMPDSPASFRLFRPENGQDGPVPAVVYIHGGGMVVGKATSSDAFCHNLAQTQGVVVANVEYRLAPETPFPGPVEDCHDVLSWVFRNAGALGVDPGRISVMGHSAGGGLAAALSIMARDRGEVPVKAQFLIYPMLDYRTGTTDAPVNNLTTLEYIWTRSNNRFGWASLRGDYALDDDRIGHFSPAHVPSTAGLPPAFIAVGDLDLFLEEDSAYALRLIRERVQCEFHIYPGAAHGFDGIATAAPTISYAQDLEAALRRLL